MLLRCPNPPPRARHHMQLVRCSQAGPSAYVHRLLLLLLHAVCNTAMNIARQQLWLCAAKLQMRYSQLSYVGKCGAGCVTHTCPVCTPAGKPGKPAIKQVDEPHSDDSNKFKVYFVLPNNVQ